MIHALAVLMVTAMASSVLGVFLTLRRLSMLTDAISHAVLLGIAMAFLITWDLTSPLLVIGASLMGLVTVWVIEKLGRTGLMHYDDATGVVYPVFFSLAIILISKFAKNANLCADMVLMGEVIYSGLNTVQVFGLTLSVSFIKMALALVLNLAFVLVFYKELKLSTFDPEYASLIGVPTGLIFYGLMALTSLTAVMAFDAVGSILVISFFIAPASTALLLTDRLSHVLGLSLLIGAANSFVGYQAALAMNASMSGMVALVNMTVYMVVLLVNKNGLVTDYFRKVRQREEMVQAAMIIHIANHTSTGVLDEEVCVQEIDCHLDWPREKVQKTAEALMKQGLIQDQAGFYTLTDAGMDLYAYLRDQYFFDG